MKDTPGADLAIDTQIQILERTCQIDIPPHLQSSETAELPGTET